MDCVAGQPKSQGFKYAIDPGRAAAGSSLALAGFEGDGFANDKIAMPPSQLLENLHGIQRRQNLTLSPELKNAPVCDLGVGEPDLS